ncbi:MAG TPA: DUF6263 family protein [Flavisolibacter sp.]|nr:DUF6263 family protein [Flavisolibacter sp.]
MKKIILLAAVVLSLNAYAQTINGKINFMKGQKLEVVTETQKTTAMEVMGQSMESTVNSTMTEAFDIEDVTDKGATIEYKVKRLVFNANGMGNTQSFDSEKEGDRNGQLGKMLEKSLKNKYKMNVDAYGNITAVTKDDDNPNAPKDAEAEALQGIVSSQLGLNFGVPKTGDASFFKILPGKELTKGDSWTDSASAAGHKRTTVYTVSDITENEVVLNYTEQIDINATQQIMGQEANIKANDKITGLVTIDKASGLLKQKTATIDNSSTIEAQGMSIPSTGKTTLTIKITAK